MLLFTSLDVNKHEYDYAPVVMTITRIFLIYLPKYALCFHAMYLRTSLEGRDITCFHLTERNLTAEHFRNLMPKFSRTFQYILGEKRGLFSPREYFSHFRLP